MLGREMAGIEFAGYEVIELNRSTKPVSKYNKHLQIDSELSSVENRLNFNDIEFVVNCAGLIRQKIDESNPDSVNNAIISNHGIPLKLITLSEKFDFKVIQIGTDCVFSGQRGSYVESDWHDAIDLYGKSKSLGEIPHKNVSVIRTSIIGKEVGSNTSLLSWLLSQPQGAIVPGFTDQLWNGVTVRHFAKFVQGIIEKKTFDKYAGVHHVVPANKVTKEGLLRNLASAFHREDIEVFPVSSGRVLDMTLSTNNPQLNDALWKIAGYPCPVSIEEMILEYSFAKRPGG
jgi:dTDP-4-dehydrorhamnose reductase